MRPLSVGPLDLDDAVADLDEHLARNALSEFALGPLDRDDRVVVA